MPKARVLFCLAAILALGACAGRAKDAAPPPVAKLIAEIFPPNGPVRPPYELARYDVAGEPAKDLDELKARALKRQELLEAIWWLAKKSGAASAGTEAADLSLLAYAFGEGTLEDAKTAAEAAGATHQLRLARLLVAECRYEAAVPMLIRLAGGDGAVANEALAALAFMAEGRKALHRISVPLLPLAVDLEDWLSKQAKVPARDSLIEALRKATLVEMSRIGNAPYTFAGEVQPILDDVLPLAESDIVAPPDLLGRSNPELAKLLGSTVNLESLKSIYLQCETNDLVLYRPTLGFVSGKEAEFRLHSAYNGPVSFRLYRFKDRGEWEQVTPTSLLAIQPERTWVQEFFPLSLNNRGRIMESALKVEGLKEGFYLLAAEARYAPVLAGQKFAVSQVALYARAARNRAIVVAVNRKTGAPVSGVPVQLHLACRASTGFIRSRTGEKTESFWRGFEKQNIELGKGTSAWPRLSADELAQYLEGVALRERYPDGEQTMDGKTGNDGLAVFDVDIGRPEYAYTLHAERIGEGEAKVNVSYTEPGTPADDLKSVVWFSQPAYRPGSTAKFKGIVRRFNGIRVAAHEPGWKEKVDVEVKNETGTLWKGACALTNAGTFSGEFPLAATANLGSYEVLLDGGLAGPHSPLKIEHFRLPTFRVRCLMTHFECKAGATTTGHVNVHYFTGEPAIGAEVEVLLDWKTAPFQTFVTTDEKGEATFEMPVPTVAEDEFLSIRATAMDASGQSFSGDSSIHVRAAPFQLEVSAEPDTVFEKSPIRIRVAAKGWDGKPLAGVTVSAEGASRAELTDAQGQAFVTHGGLNKTSGSDRLNVTATLGQEAVHGSCRVTIVEKPKEEKKPVQTSEAQPVKEPVAPVIPEQAHLNRFQFDNYPYKVPVGKPAKFSFRLDRADGGETLVLVVAENLRALRHQTMLVKPGQHEIELPTDLDCTPSLRVTALAFLGGRPEEQHQSLYVEPTQQFLTLQVATDKHDYRPGERCVAELKAVDFRGEPVAQAEISLGVVNEAVYVIASDLTPDLESFFYHYELPVYATGAYDAPPPECPIILYFKGPKYAWGFLGAPEGGIGGDRGSGRGSFGSRHGGGRALVRDVKVRKDFRTEAYWVANLVTGPDGRARTEFSFPDDITTWRFTARGVTADTKVGEVVHSERTLLPVQVELALPRALRAGDRITAGALVRNNEGGGRTVKVSLNKDAGNAQKELALGRGLTQRVDFPLAPSAAGTMTLAAKAEDAQSKEGDAIERPLDVLPRGYPVGRSFSGTVKEGGEVPLAFGRAGVPENLQVVFSVEPGLVGPIVSALDELIQYPYGCVEQTMSRFMPAVVAGRALKKGGLPNPREKDLARVLEKGIERLAGFQHQDGGWGWWKEDATNDFMTAYVLEGLALCRQAGHAVPAGMIENSERYLFERVVEEKLQGRQVGAIGAASLPLNAAHALALCYAAEPERFAEQLKRLTAVVLKQPEWPLPRDAALLADTLCLLGRPEEARTALAVAVETIKTERNRNSLMALATLLEAGVALSPADPRWMLKARELVKLRQGKGWGDTLTSAAAVRGLAALLTGPAKDLGPVELLADGRVVRKLETKPNERVSVSLSGELAGAKVLSFRSVKEPADDLFWSARETGFLTKPLPDAEKPVATVDVRVSTTGPGAKELEIGADGVLGVKRGTTLKVRLVCNVSESMEYLRISLPRPCGVELVRPPRRGRDVTAFEERDDGFHFFVREWGKGEHEIEFLVRAECAGEVFAPPPELEPMYAGALPLKTRGPVLWRIAD